MAVGSVTSLSEVQAKHYQQSDNQLRAVGLMTTRQTLAVGAYNDCKPFASYRKMELRVDLTIPCL